MAAGECPHGKSNETCKQCRNGVPPTQAPDTDSGDGGKTKSPSDSG